MSETVVSLVFAISLGLYLAGAAVSLLLAEKRALASRVGHALALTAGLAGIAAATAVLLGPKGYRPSVSMPLYLPFSPGDLVLDKLSAFFLLLISVGATAAALYAPSYLKSYEKRKSTGWLAAALNLFALSMIMVVTSGDGFLFLVAWESMSVLSYLLVVTDHEEPAASRAGFIYVVMTHAATAFITAAFLIMFHAAGSAGFADFTAAATGLPGWIRNLVFIFLLMGFGTKAGLIPLHIWLPQAYQVAPAHFSALMSGVMSKTAVYGIIRFGYAVLGGGPGWWGVLVMALGLISVILGVLYALMESDLKRLVAFSSIENIGIILVGVGASFLAHDLGQEAVAAALLAAALLHVLNHSFFKGLLFQATGAVQHAAHTLNVEELGGLIRKMPQTAILFLGAAGAISALPPLNGFVSEILALKGLIALAGTGSPAAVRLWSLLAAAGLAFAGALAVAAFVKAFGITFLGLPRSKKVEEAHEAPAGMRAGMWLLLVLCLAVGLVPAPFIAVVNRVAQEVTMGLPGYISFPRPGAQAVPWTGDVGTLAPVLAILLAVGVWVIFRAARSLSGKSPVRVSEPWVCGNTLQPDMQYSGGALVKPLRVFFSGLLRPRREVTRQDNGSRYFPRVIHYEARLNPVYEKYFYAPASRALLAVSDRLRRIQDGSVQAYLAYILVTLALLLVLAR